MNTDNGSLAFDFYLDNARLQQTALEAERRIKGITDTAVNEGKRAEGSFNGFGAAMAAIGGTAFLGMIGNKIISVRGEFQQLGVAFETMLGSKEKADTLMAQIVDTAAKTPFTLTEVAQGAKQLLAYQVAAEDVNETVKRLGDISSGVSVPLSRLILVYGQVKAKGRLMGDDLRQFTEAGIPIIHELAKSMGVADSEILKMVENGKVGFPEVQKVIENLTNEGGMFFNLMEKQSLTITGRISNMKDAFDRMFNSIGESNEGLIADGIVGITDLVDNYETVGKVLFGLVAVYGSYKAAVIVANAVSILQRDIAFQQILANIGNTGTTIELTAAEGIAAVAKSRLTAAQLALNSSMLANPYVLATMALVALAVVIYSVSEAHTEAEIAQKRYADAVDGANTKIDEEKAKSTALLSVINDEGNSREFRNQKLKEFITLNPEILNGLTLENIKTTEGISAINGYVKALEGKIKMQMLDTELTESIKRSAKAERGGENLDWWDKTKVAVAAATGNGALAAVTGIEATMKNNKAVIDAEKDLQKKLKAEINKATGGDSKKAGEEVANVIINADYWEEQVKSAKASLDKLNTNSKTYSADRKKLLNQIAQGENELNNIRGKKSKGGTEKKDTNDFDQARIDAQKKALAEENSLIRKGIEDKIKLLDDGLKQQDITFQDEQDLVQKRIAAKKELIDFDLRQTIKGIDDEEKELIKKAKKAGVKNPDLSSFDSIRSSATAKANSDKAAIDAEQIKQNKENLERMLAQYQSFEDQRKALNEKYEKERKTLLEGKNKDNAVKVDSSVGVLDKTNVDANEEIDRQIAEKEIAFKGFLDRIAMMGLQELQNALEAANVAMQNSNGTDEEKAIMRAKTKALQEELKQMETNGGKDTKADVISNAGLKKSKDTITVLQNVNDEVGNVINSFDGLDDNTKQALNAASNIAGAVLASISGIMALSVTGAEAIKGVERASVILAIIGAAIAVMTIIVGLFDSARKKREEREIDKYADAVENLKDKYDELGRSIDKALGGNKFKFQKDAIENLKAQQVQYANLIKAEKDKKKSDGDKVKEYNDSIQDNINAIQDTITKMREDILGMDVSSAADQLGSAIIDAFSAGEDAAAAWGKKVNEIVGDVIRKMLIQKLVEEPVGNIINKYMAQWVDSEGNFLGFDSVMGSADQMGKELAALGPGISSILDALPEDIKKYITGETGSGAGKTALSGAIKSVSEDTAGVISGQLNAMRINQIDSITVLRQQLLSLSQIEVNTRNLDGILIAMNTLVNGGRAHGLW